MGLESRPWPLTSSQSQVSPAQPQSPTSTIVLAVPPCNPKIHNKTEQQRPLPGDHHHGPGSAYISPLWSPNGDNNSACHVTIILAGSMPLSQLREDESL